MNELKLLLENIAKALVDFPNAVMIEVKEGERTTLFMLKVDTSDLGKIIGKKGVTAAALRTIVKGASAKLNRRFHLDIVE